MIAARVPMCGERFAYMLDGVRVIDKSGGFSVSRQAVRVSRGIYVSLDDVLPLTAAERADEVFRNPARSEV